MTVKHPKLGDSIELVCTVKNLPKRFDLNWVFNEKKIHAHVLTSANGTYGSGGKFKRNRHARHSARFFIGEEEKRAEETEQRLANHRHRNAKRSHHQQQQHEMTGHHGYTIFNENVNNVTVSRLKITDLSDAHRGVYKCRYDKIETKLTLEFKSHLKAKLKMLDYVYASSGNGNGAQTTASLVLRNSELFVLVLLGFISYRFYLY